MDFLGVGVLVASAAVIMSGKSGDLMDFGKNAVGSIMDFLNSLFNGEQKNLDNELNPEQGEGLSNDESSDKDSDMEMDADEQELKDGEHVINDEDVSDHEDGRVATDDPENAGDKTGNTFETGKTEEGKLNEKNKPQTEQKVEMPENNSTEQAEKSSVQVLKNNDLLEKRRSGELQKMMSDFGDIGLLDKVVSTGSSILTNYDIERNSYAKEMANYLTTVGGLRAMDGDTVLNENDTRRMLEGQLTNIANHSKSTADFIEKTTTELERRVNNDEYKELMDAAPRNMAIYDVMKNESEPNNQKLYDMYGKGIHGLSYKDNYLNNLTDKFMMAKPRSVDGTEISEKEMRDKIYGIMDKSLAYCVGNSNTKLNMFFNISQQMDKAGIELSTSDRYRDVSISDRKVRTKDMMMAESDGKIDSVEQALYKTNGFKEKDVGKSEKPVEQNVGFARF